MAGGPGGVSRRTVVRGVGGAAFVGASLAALKLPFFSVSGAQQDPATCFADDVSATDKKLIVSNWPAYIDPIHKPGSTVSVFEQQTGISVQYTDDVNDNAEFYAKVKNQLASCQSIKRDMIVMTDWMAARMIGLGWIQPLDPAKMPNFTKNLIPRLRDKPWDPQAKHHAPWQSGLTGIAYNADKTKEVKSFTELLTRSDLKGKVTLLTEMRDTMGFMLRTVDADPEKFTQNEWENADQLAPRLRLRRQRALVQRQRLPQRPRLREHAGLRGVVRRRDHRPAGQPEHQVRGARGGHVAVGRQHADPQPRDPPVERRGVDQLLLRPEGRRAARGLELLHLPGRGGPGGDAQARQARPRRAS